MIMMLPYYHQTTRHLHGVILLLLSLACSVHSTRSLASASLLLGKRVTAADLSNYRQASIEIILKIAQAVNLNKHGLAKQAGISHLTLQSHLRGEKVMQDTPLSKLQTGMSIAIANVAMEEEDRQHYHALINDLPQTVRVERRVSHVEKMVEQGRDTPECCSQQAASK